MRVVDRPVNPVKTKQGDQERDEIWTVFSIDLRRILRFRPFLLSPGEKRSSRAEDESRDLGEDDMCLVTYIVRPRRRAFVVFIVL